MRITGRIDEVRSIVHRAKSGGKSIALVPTMGALHAGHLSLIERARQSDDFVVVSVFVNPTQFAPGEDYEKYPRQIDDDARAVEQIGGDLVFAPAASEMYPQQQLTYVTVDKLTEPLCGAFREGHFRGVTTVVTKLLNIVAPDRAFFGQKDYQQLAVIKRMVEDLNMTTEIVGCPTVREADGLALSSRNKYLSAEHRAAAPVIYQSLQLGAQAVRQGMTPAEAEALVAANIEKTGILHVQYAQALDPYTLQKPAHAGAPVLLAVAVHAGETRLIDNIVIEA